MSATESRDAKSMLYGGYIGKLHYIIEQGLDVHAVRNDSHTLNLMTAIINSINKKHIVSPADIYERAKQFSVDLYNFKGSVVYAVSPLTFADIFGTDGYDLDECIKKIVDFVTHDEKIQLLCVEYIHLLHDILWFKIEQQEIIDVLPAIDVLESEVKCSHDEHDIFFAGLWSFVFSKDYVTAYENAAGLKNTNSDICGVACTLAGLYYGVDSIPSDWSERVFTTWSETEEEQLPVL